MTKKAYSIPEFCETFSVGRTKVFSEIRAGRLRVVKFGTKNLVPAENADAWLTSLISNTPQKQAA